MAKKEVELTGQSLKTLRDHYKMSYDQFNKNIEKIRPLLDEIAGRTNYRQLTPKQVELIVKHLEGEK
ncbi:MAG: hypothetical protein ACT4ON_13570 [Bacteroidota bacterium]